MKTKLEVGKEYWLGESRKFKGIYKGSLGKAHYFYITYGDDNFTHDSNGFVEFPLHGVFEIEQWQFTTPIAMKCTEEQFNEIKGKLVEMGYILYGITFGEKYRYLSSNFDNDVRCITDLAIGSKYFKECNPIIFESFNPDLFLALAAMTDKEDGIKGEWWKSGLTGKLIMQSESSFLHLILRKATAQEIIEHFEKKEFMLQPRWYVELTESNRDIVIPWHKSIDKRSGRAYDIGAYYGIFESGTGDAWSSRELASQYQIITFDQFKKYVLKETEQSCQVIPIPPTKQATLFDDRVEITDWKPKEGDFVFYIAYWNDEFRYTNTFYNDNFKKEFNNGFIKRTECEAKRLVEKLKQAML